MALTLTEREEIQLETIEYFLHSGHSIRIIITYAENALGISPRPVPRNSIVLTNRFGEFRLVVMKEAVVQLNHLALLRTEEVTG